MEKSSRYQRFVVVRPFVPEDELECKSIAHQSIMSTVQRTFFTALLRETTFQLMIFFAAILFIIVNVPFGYCIMSVPLTVMLVYTSVWGVKMVTSMEIQQEMILTRPVMDFITETTKSSVLSVNQQIVFGTVNFQVTIV